jgi:hypothetical protein
VPKMKIEEKKRKKVAQERTKDYVNLFGNIKA